MASELYVAEDGSIHRHPVTVEHNTSNCSNTYAPILVENIQSRTEYSPNHHVSDGRIIGFWMVSIIISLLIAVGITQGLGTEVYGSDGGFVATIGPVVVFVGSIVGSILYGIFCAKSIDYNLWAYILSALSSIGGIIALAIVCFILMILFYMLIVGFVVVIMFCMLGGAFYAE